MDVEWCREVLEEAVSQHGCPEIINTDQGSQFASEAFTGAVLSKGIRLSMGGKGRVIDNVFIEQFCRKIKYEKVYLNPPADGLDLYAQLAEYIDYYHHMRKHSR